MSIKFILADQEMPYLTPSSIQDYLPETHLGRFVVEIVDDLDLSHFSDTDLRERLQVLIPEKREKHKLPLKERFKTAPQAPDHPSPLEAMKHRMLTKEGK